MIAMIRLLASKDEKLSRLTQVTDPWGTYGFTYDNLGRLLGTGGLVQGERSPAVLCQSIMLINSRDGRIAQSTGCSAGVDKDVNRRAELALRQPANSIHIEVWNESSNSALRKD
jgi:hypothetical protein